MQRFQFRLEPILKIRRYREKEWEMKLARISGICFDLQNRIEIRREEIRKSFLSEGSGFDISILSSQELYRTRLQKERVSLSEELKKREKEKEKVKQSYLEASKERKVMDKLAERKESEYYRRQLREETKTLDDLAGGAAARHILAAEESC